MRPTLLDWQQSRVVLDPAASAEMGWRDLAAMIDARHHSPTRGLFAAMGFGPDGRLMHFPRVPVEPEWSGASPLSSGNVFVNESLRDRRSRRTSYDLLLEHLGVSLANKTMLDLGCGDGTLGALCAPHVGMNGRIIGIDRDASAIALARRRHAAANITWDVADVANYATPNPIPHLASASIDIALSHLALMLMPLSQIIAELERVIKPGGCFAAVIPRLPTSDAERRYVAAHDILASHLPRTGMAASSEPPQYIVARKLQHVADYSHLFTSSHWRADAITHHDFGIDLSGSPIDVIDTMLATHVAHILTSARRSAAESDLWDLVVKSGEMFHTEMVRPLRFFRVQRNS